MLRLVMNIDSATVEECALQHKQSSSTMLAWLETKILPHYRAESPANIKDVLSTQDCLTFAENVLSSSGQSLRVGLEFILNLWNDTRDDSTGLRASAFTFLLSILAREEYYFVRFDDIDSIANMLMSRCNIVYFGGCRVARILVHTCAYTLGSQYGSLFTETCLTNLQRQETLYCMPISERTDSVTHTLARMICACANLCHDGDRKWIQQTPGCIVAAFLLGLMTNGYNGPENQETAASASVILDTLPLYIDYEATQMKKTVANHLHCQAVTTYMTKEDLDTVKLSHIGFKSLRDHFYSRFPEYVSISCPWYRWLKYNVPYERTISSLPSSRHVGVSDTCMANAGKHFGVVATLLLREAILSHETADDIKALWDIVSQVKDVHVHRLHHLWTSTTLAKGSEIDLDVLLQAIKQVMNDTALNDKQITDASHILQFITSRIDEAGTRAYSIFLL